MYADGKIGVHDLLDVGEGDLTVPGRTEGHRDRARNVESRTSGHIRADTEACDRFRGGTVKVGEIVCLAGRDVQLDLFAAAGCGSLHAFEIGHQRAVFHALAAQQGGKYLIGVRHLRHGPGTHKRADLNDRKARIGGCFDHLLLFLYRQNTSLVLQTVTRTDLAERDMIDKIQSHFLCLA